MRILVVAATTPEIEPFVAGLRYKSDGDSRVTTYARAGHDVDVLTTGVGMVATAAGARACWRAPNTTWR